MLACRLIPTMHLPCPGSNCSSTSGWWNTWKNRPTNMPQKWRSTTTDWRRARISKKCGKLILKEMNGFILILIHMGVVKKSSITDYCSTEILFTYSPPSHQCASLFQEDFEHVPHEQHQQLHNSQRDNYGPLHKVKPIYEHPQVFSGGVYSKKICHWWSNVSWRVAYDLKSTYNTNPTQNQ